MTALTQAGYEQTREKLADLQNRLAALKQRTDLKPQHLADVCRSYEQMIRQYRREIKLFESSKGESERSADSESPRRPN